MKNISSKCYPARKVCIDIYECMISDMSGNMKLQDMKPSRLLCVLNLLEKFTEEFFHLNPISQIGIIATKNKRAEIISDLAGNPKAHVEQIRKLAGNTGSRSGTSTSNAQAANSACSGEPSLQNSLELAMQTLKHMPAHATREVRVLKFKKSGTGLSL